jgi:glutathione S-transferase
LSTGLKSTAVPFLIRPITRAVANQIISIMIFPAVKRHLGLLEKFLEEPLEGGNFMCGHLTGADILLSYPLIASKDGAFDEMGKYDKGTFSATYPKLHAYAEMLAKEPGWQKSAEKIKELEGSFSLIP